MEFLYGTWHWAISGLFIGLIMLVLIYFGKAFGMSSNLRTMCSMAGAGKHSSFFVLDWKEQKWSLAIVIGAILGGFVAYHFLQNGTEVAINPNTIGFGSRYAGGCTSGHAISGMSNLQLPSLIAVIGFFIGGLIMAHLILPILF